MRKLLSLYALFLGVTVSLAAVKPGENLLFNGEFNGKPRDPVTGFATKAPDFWGASNSVDNITFSPSGAPSGKGIIRISETTPGKEGYEAIVKQSALSLVPGETYRLSAMVRTKDFVSNHHGIVIYDTGWYHDVGLNSFPENQDWTRVSKDITMIESRKNDFTLAIFACHFKGTLEVADIKLEAITEKALKDSSPSSVATLLGKPMLTPMKPLLNKIIIPANGEPPQISLLFSGKLEGDTPFSGYDLRYTVNDLPVNSQPLIEGYNTIQFKNGVKPGDFALKLSIVNRASGKLLCEQNYTATFIPAPNVSTKNHRRLNNLVIELLNTPIAKSADAQSFDFSTRRDGWVFIAAQNAQAEKLEVALDGKQIVIQADTPRLETFRAVSYDAHTLTVKGAVNGGNLIVRSIPEILSYCPGLDGEGLGNPHLDWDFQEKYVNFALTTHNGGRIPEAARKPFLEHGQRWISSIGTTHISARDLAYKLENCAGMTMPQFQGVTCDEQAFGDLDSTLPFAEGLKRFVPKNDHIVYTWIYGQPTLPGSDTDFISACLNTSRGQGRILTEVYCRSRKTRKEADEYLDEFITKSAAAYRQFFPGVENQWGFILGNFNLIPVITLAHHTNVDYKYYLDMQMNLLANTPSCKDMGVTGYWGTLFADSEMARWSFLLTRHYCIEGKKTMLSDEYGFSFDPGHLLNGDFIDGLANWTPEGNVTIGQKDGYSNASQNRWGGNNGVGNTFAVLNKKNAEVSSVTQTARKLIPGKAYCLQFITVDYNDLMSNTFNPRRIGIDATLDNGASIDKAHSWLHIDQRKKGNYAFNHNAPKVNLHHIVFKAVKPEVTVTIHNTAAAKGEAAAVNYVTLNPYLPEN